MRRVMLLLLLLAVALGCALWAGDAPAEEPAALLPAVKVNPKDGAEMVLIPAGEFLMGTSEEELAAWLKDHPDDKRGWFTNEQPQHKVYLDAFYLYKYEVTVAQYRKFCKATKRKMPPEPYWGWQDAHPIGTMDWNDAKAYADWAGVALPTEAQWEKAARGGDGRLYPWGNAWPPPKGAGNLVDLTAKRKFPYMEIIDGYDDGYEATAPVGTFAANPYGVHDLAGNVREWCADWFDEDYYQNAPAKNPPGPSEIQASVVNVMVIREGQQNVMEKAKARVVRGGSWNCSTPDGCRTTYRLGSLPSFLSNGFRCVLRSPGLP